MTNSLAESPAAERNKAPILDVLRRTLPAEGSVVEIASGTGQHVVHFAGALPALTWQPSDPDASMVAAIRARLQLAALPNVREPLALDVHDLPWPIEQADALVCINMIHIAPWSATQALFAGAAAHLSTHPSIAAPVVLYGPYRIGGAHTAPSNEAFDQSLKARNAEWGVRDLEAVAEVAGEQGFELSGRFAMPANNFVVVFRRR